MWTKECCLCWWLWALHLELHPEEIVVGYKGSFIHGTCVALQYDASPLPGVVYCVWLGHIILCVAYYNQEASSIFISQDVPHRGI